MSELKLRDRMMAAFQEHRDTLRERMTAVVLARYGGLSDSSSIVENCIRVAQEAVDAVRQQANQLDDERGMALADLSEARRLLDESAGREHALREALEELILKSRSLGIAIQGGGLVNLGREAVQDCDTAAKALSLPSGAAAVNRIRAEAFDEGFTVGAAKYASWSDIPPNPYREAVTPEAPKVCAMCGGRGEQYWDDEAKRWEPIGSTGNEGHERAFADTRPCPTCAPCEKCGGTGRVEYHGGEGGAPSPCEPCRGTGTRGEERT